MVRYQQALKTEHGYIRRAAELLCFDYRTLTNWATCTGRVSDGTAVALRASIYSKEAFHACKRSSTSHTRHRRLH